MRTASARPETLLHFRRGRRRFGRTLVLLRPARPFLGLVGVALGPLLAVRVDRRDLVVAQRSVLIGVELRQFAFRLLGKIVTNGLVLLRVDLPVLVRVVFRE